MELLPADEAGDVSRHALQCSSCREELGRVRGDLATLAITAEAVAPSAAARGRLLEQVAREKKVIPSAAAQPANKPEGAPRPLADFGRGRGSTLSPEPAILPSRRAPASSWPGWAAAATLAVVSGFLYMDHRALQENLSAQSSEMQRLNARAAQSHELMDALTDPEAKRVTLTPKSPPRGPVAGITYNPLKGSLVFLASNLDPLQVYKTYELWVIPSDGSAPIPAGMFHPDEHGNANVVMPNIPKRMEAKSFGVTIEDAGGSDKPTMPIIMAGG